MGNVKHSSIKPGRSGLEKESSDNLVALRAKAAEEPIASFLQMKLVELSPGYAKVVMKVRPEYKNFNDMVFGGIVMSIADQAFAYATNSLVSPSIATQFNIYLIAGAGIDDELTAECRVVKSGRRISISEMTVTNQDGRLIARASGSTIGTG